MRESLSGRERAGVATAIVVGLAMMVYGSGKLNVGDGHAGRGPTPEVPRFKSECIVDLAGYAELSSWDDIYQVGVDLDLIDPESSVDDLVAFNGLPPDYDPDKVDFIDVCVGDGREHGYVGFYGKVPESIPDITSVQATSVPKNAFIKPAPVLEVTTLPTLTPIPTDIAVQPSSLTVTENPSDEALSCQVNSTYQLKKDLKIEISDTNISSSYVCSDTLVEGGYHVTNSHCIATIAGVRNSQYDLIDDETHRSSASYRLTHESGRSLIVVGADYSHEEDVAVLYTVAETMHIPHEPCLELGQTDQLERFDPLQLVNYGDNAQDPKEFAVRYLGPDPENQRQSLFADGVDGRVVFDGTSRNGTLWHGGSGGSVADMESGHFVGTTSNIDYRTNAKRYERIAHYFGIDPNAFVRIGIFRSNEHVLSRIHAPWQNSQSAVSVDFPQIDIAIR